MLNFAMVCSHTIRKTGRFNRKAQKLFLPDKRIDSYPKLTFKLSTLQSHKGSTIVNSRLLSLNIGEIVVDTIILFCSPQDTGQPHDTACEVLRICALEFHYWKSLVQSFSSALSRVAFQIKQFLMYLGGTQSIKLPQSLPSKIKFTNLYHETLKIICFAKNACKHAFPSKLYQISFQSVANFKQTNQT